MFYGRQNVLEAFGKATQLAMYLGIAWPKPFATCLVTAFIGKLKCVTQDMCFDVFPDAKKLLEDVDIIGVPQRDEDGALAPFRLGNVTKPFGLPGTVDMGGLFPQARLSLTLPVSMVPLYLMDYLQKRMEDSKQLCDAFLRGFKCGERVWEHFKDVSPQVFASFFCESSNYLDPEAFMEHISLESGFDEGLIGAQRSGWFRAFMCKRENNQLRRGFLTASTGSEVLLPGSDKIKVQVANRGSMHGNNATTTYGGMAIQACFKTVTLPFFETQESCETILSAVPSHGEDYFTAA